MIDRKFIDITLNAKTIDLFAIRSAIFKVISSSLTVLNGSLLDIGCGKMPYRKYILDNSNVKSYVGLDIETAFDYEGVKPDITWDGSVIPSDGSSFDCILLTEVLEHVPNPEGLLKEAYRVLKKDGIVLFTVPYLWPLHEVPHDQYRYTPWALEKHFLNVGFEKIDIRALGGWHASMAQMLGLWVRRSPISPIQRKILSPLLVPLVRFLLSKDELNHPVLFKEGQMITSISGVATK